MHGLINKAIQSFVTHSYGTTRWINVTEAANLGFVEFEAMLVYPDELTNRVLTAMCRELGRPQNEILEDLGTFLVSDPNTEALRRLLRFGGVNYVEFLHSLDDLEDRVRLAVSDLELPALELWENDPADYRLTCHRGLPGYAYVMIGVLRAMADDYGVLAVFQHMGEHEKGEIISIRLIETAFSKGRQFVLGARAS